MLETKKDVDKTEEMIEAIIEYMDDRRREGLGNHEWDDTPPAAGSPSKSEEICRNWQQGRCNKGDNYPRKHVGASGAKSSAPKRDDTSTAERSIGPDNERCEADKLGKKCKYGTNC